VKGWLSFIAALVLFATSALSFFHWLTQACAYLPNYSLKRTDQSLRD
jgi:hypothetical protein